MNKLVVLPSLRQGFAVALILAVSFMILEPAIGYGLTTNSQFTISQSVTAEVGFVTTASNVTMSPSLGGITGGTSNGATQFAIVSNDTAGYKVTIQASSTAGMVGNASSSNSIPAYVTSGSSPLLPDYTFTVPTNKAYFGYTVDASSTSDLAPAFTWTSGTSCGSGSSGALTHCWIAATTTAYTILNRNIPTFGGTPASSTIAFQVVINSNPNPTIPNDTYVATTTLTAVAK